MITTLSIRNFVLIDSLDLEFTRGLCVLTGETGAGKSVLLDALGLVIGARADTSQIRPEGNDRAMVAATFEVAPSHPVMPLFAEYGLESLQPGEPLILRRTLSSDGRSRAFINDQPVSVSALRSFGSVLVEIEGQFANHGLLDPNNHRAALDAFANLGPRNQATRKSWESYQEARRRLEETRAEIERIAAESDYLRHVHAELAELDPRPGEEEDLAQRRTIMMHGEKIAEAIHEALAVLEGDGGLQSKIGRAVRLLERTSEQAGDHLREAVDAMDRTANEAQAAAELLSEALSRLDRDPGNLQRVEERLFALRGLARKHKTSVESLPELAETFASKLGRLDAGEQDLAQLEAEATRRRDIYLADATDLSAKRHEAARLLDARIADELPDLRLDAAQFTTIVDSSVEERAGPNGIDSVCFEVSANPGLPPGPVGKVVSGGELSRLLLALKVVLFHGSPDFTLVFDEVDSGIGGKTAAAVAARLYQLAADTQILVVTHSPQVAARGTSHFRVRKTISTQGDSDRTTASVIALSDDERCEEIARMLAGSRITREARAAAASLIADASQ